MGIAKARLTKEICVQQLVQDVAQAWGDTEHDAMLYLADLLLRDSQIRFYYPGHREEEDEDGKPIKFRAKLGVRGGTSAVEVRLRRMVRDNEDWDVEMVVVDGDRPEPLKDLMVDKAAIIERLRTDAMPVPPQWLGAMTDIKVQEGKAEPNTSGPKGDTPTPTPAQTARNNWVKRAAEVNAERKKRLGPSAMARILNREASKDPKLKTGDQIRTAGTIRKELSKRLEEWR